MKRIFTLGTVFCCLMLSAQKKKNERYQDILNTKDIAKIENFLKTAHPEDPRRSVLKPKLIALKNSAWTQGKLTAKPMAARPITTEIPTSFLTRPNSDESAEFIKLISETSDAQKQKTLKLLNTLFDQDITKKESILLIQNNSDCNMILRIQGAGSFYNLAVPAHGENSIVMNKGTYELTSNMCDQRYTATKELKKNMIVILNKPAVDSATNTAAPAGSKPPQKQNSKK